MRRSQTVAARALLLLTIALVSSALASAAELAEVEYTPDITYATVGGEELQLDVARPKGLSGPAPAIVLIHGGGFMYGRRQEMTAQAKRFAAHGYVAVPISYRLVPKHRFPAQIEDVQAAVRYLREHAGELKIDPQRIGATGISAGAHLSMMLGALDSSDGFDTSGGNPQHSSKVQAVVSFVGPASLALGEYSIAQEQIIAAFVGGPTKERMDVCRRASPITYINSGDAPLLCFFGTDDPLVPYEQAFDIAKVLDDADVPGRVEILVGARHGWAGKELERTQSATIEFFDEHLKSAAR